VFRKYYLRPIVQIGIYFFLLFSIFAIILPFVLQALSAWVFLSSGALSLLFIFGYIALSSRYIDKVKFGIGRFVKPIVAIFIFMNVLYFLNIIPPIPLSLKDAVVGHSVNMSGGAYTILIEEELFLERIMPWRTIHKKTGGTVAVYTAIFAPGSLEVDIFHNWQHKEGGKWVSKDRLSYGIAGGRKEGFRGYSKKTSVPEGKWRVDVETARGQVLGRIWFDVIETEEPLPLLQVVR